MLLNMINLETMRKELWILVYGLITVANTMAIKIEIILIEAETI